MKTTQKITILLGLTLIICLGFSLPAPGQERVKADIDARTSDGVLQPVTDTSGIRVIDSSLTIDGTTGTIDASQITDASTTDTLDASAIRDDATGKIDAAQDTSAGVVPTTQVDTGDSAGAVTRPVDGALAKDDAAQAIDTSTGTSAVTMPVDGAQIKDDATRPVDGAQIKDDATRPLDGAQIKDDVVTGTADPNQGTSAGGGLNTAATSTCGNNEKEEGEDCDGTDTPAGKTCSGNCTFIVEEPRCGDGNVDEGELCDPDMASPTWNTTIEYCDPVKCEPFCKSTKAPSINDSCSVCGNGIVEEGEVCDDGNIVSNDGCSGRCESEEKCGDGAVQAAMGEICDDGNDDNTDTCRNDCQPPKCGDGFVQPGEVCDDGNILDGDRCPANCQIADGEVVTCGNKALDNDEECDSSAPDYDQRKFACTQDCKLICKDTRKPPVDGSCREEKELCPDGSPPLHALCMQIQNVSGSNSIICIDDFENIITNFTLANVEVREQMAARNDELYLVTADNELLKMKFTTNSNNLARVAVGDQMAQTKGVNPLPDGKLLLWENQTVKVVNNDNDKTTEFTLNIKEQISGVVKNVEDPAYYVLAGAAIYKYHPEDQATRKIDLTQSLSEKELALFDFSEPGKLFLVEKDILHAFYPSVIFTIDLATQEVKAVQMKNVEFEGLVYDDQKKEFMFLAPDSAGIRIVDADFIKEESQKIEGEVLTKPPQEEYLELHSIKVPPKGMVWVDICPQEEVCKCDNCCDDCETEIECSDGTRVASKDECPVVVVETVTVTKFICSNGLEALAAEDCIDETPEPTVTDPASALPIEADGVIDDTPDVIGDTDEPVPVPIMGVLAGSGCISIAGTTSGATSLIWFILFLFPIVRRRFRS